MQDASPLSYTDHKHTLLPRTPTHSPTGPRHTLPHRLQAHSPTQDPGTLYHTDCKHTLLHRTQAYSTTQTASKLYTVQGSTTQTGSTLFTVEGHQKIWLTEPQECLVYRGWPPNMTGYEILVLCFQPRMYGLVSLDCVEISVEISVVCGV